MSEKLNEKILLPEIQEFIFEQSKSSIDITRFILAGSPFGEVSIQELAQQIQGRKKAKNKLPTWHKTQRIFYPPTLNLEQTSSEATASYKSNLVNGNTLIDITGGMGIDDYYFSKKITTVIHCELNPSLSAIAAHNFETLNASNIKTSSGDGIKILEKQSSVDWIYIDPSRRHDSKGKVFFLEDCLPNVPEQLDFLFSKSTNILVKTSPLLDIDNGIQSLQGVKEIHIVAVQNEVKELLWVLQKSYEGEISMYCTNLKKDTDQQFSFILSEEANSIITYSNPKKYVYEPNATILKAGGFVSVGLHYNLEKLHTHSHLYTNDTLIDFPGRSFEIMKTIAYNKKTIKQLGIQKANITTRNFPESVVDIRKKFKIKDGGEHYLFFTTDYQSTKIVLVCKKC